MRRRPAAATRTAIAADRNQRIRHVEPSGPGRNSQPTTRAFGLLAEMVAEGRTGSVVTLLADRGDRYADTYFCDEWVKAHGLDTAAPTAALTEFERSGRWD